MALGENAFKRHLRACGISTTVDKDSPDLLSPAEKVIEHLVQWRTIDYAGPLSGRDEGFIKENGTRVLVTKTAKPIEPKPGPFPTIRAIIAGLLGGGEHGERQIATFYGWLHFAVDSLTKRLHQPGQALALAGERDTGKSLLQQIITEILGGRAWARWAWPFL